jgi:hypothetical protein
VDVYGDCFIDVEVSTINIRHMKHPTDLKKKKRRSCGLSRDILPNQLFYVLDRDAFNKYLQPLVQRTATSVRTNTITRIVDSLTVTLPSEQEETDTRDLHVDIHDDECKAYGSNVYTCITTIIGEKIDSETVVDSSTESICGQRKCAFHP